MLTKQSKLLLFLIIAILIVGFFLYRDISVIQKYIPHMIIISIIYGIGIYLYSRYEKLESVENAVIVGAIHAIGMLTFLFMLRASYERRMA
jgi:hypothetical protein